MGGKDQNPKVGGVILTHGQLSNELLAAAETIAGQINHISAVSIGWHDDVETAKEAVARAIEEVSSTKGVLLLTDLFGGTATNIAAMFLKENEVELLTGVNLPMVIKIAQQEPDADLESLAHEVLNAGREGIYQAGELLVPIKKRK